MPTQAASQTNGSGVTRRQFMKLAGTSTAAAVLLGLPYSAAWAKGGPSGTPNTVGGEPESVSLGGLPDAATLNSARSSPEVAAAVRTFGALDWTQAQNLNRDHKAFGLVVPFTGTPYRALSYVPSKSAASMVLRTPSPL
ncbi:MAG: twin-arginine translocation signal domain-containing protein [Acidimicrobiales bacterium]